MSSQTHPDRNKKLGTSAREDSMNSVLGQAVARIQISRPKTPTQFPQVEPHWPLCHASDYIILYDDLCQGPPVSNPSGKLRKPRASVWTSPSKKTDRSPNWRPLPQRLTPIATPQSLSCTGHVSTLGGMTCCISSAESPRNGSHPLSTPM